MKRNVLKNGVISAAVLVLLLQPNYINLDQPIAHAAAASIAQKSVSLGASSSLHIRDARLLMQDNGLLLAYTVTITNNGSIDLDLNDYWFRVKTKNGQKFTTALSTADKGTTKVAPRSAVNLTYTALVSTSVKLSDLQFDVVKWDFSVPGYERILGTIQYPQNSAGKTPVFQPSVMVIDNTKLKGAVKQYFVTNDQNGFYLTISFLLENVGYSSATLTNLGFAMQTDSYSVYDVQAASLAQTTIQPKERKIVTMQAKLPMAVAGKNLTLVPYTNDEASKSKIPYGAFLVPAVKASAPAKSNETKTAYLEGQVVKTQVEQTLINDNDGKKEISLEYVINHAGNMAITMPNLEFSIRTKNNVTYPLSYTKDENAMLLPGIEQRLYLTGAIPTGVNENDAQLVVKTQTAEGKEGYMIGAYSIKSVAQQGNVGGTFTYNKDYTIKLDAVHRTPLEETDMLVAELSITNKSTTAKSTPAGLNGYFLVNGVKVSNTGTSVSLDNTISIAPGATYRMAVHTKIPYTTTIDQIGFVLTEKLSDTSTKSVYQFAGQTISSVPVINKNANYKVDIVGSRSTAKMVQTHVFEGEKNNYFYSEIEVSSDESRSSTVAELGGYLKDKSGQLVPVKFTKTDQRVASGGKVLLTAYGVTSKSFNVDDFEFIMGQSFNGAAGGSNNEPEKLLVSPVSYKIKDAAATVKSDFTDIKYAGYTIDFRNILATLNVSGLYDVQGVKMDLSYDLERDSSYDAIAGKHQILFEFVDQEPAKATYEKSYSILNAGENEVALKEGKFIDLQVLFNDTEIQSKVSDYKTYKLNVYGVIDDTRILLASKELRWFTRE